MNLPILRYKLPPNTRTQLWMDFLDCVEEEFSLLQTKIAEKITMRDIDTAIIDQLIELSILLSVPVDVSVSDDIDFIRNELKSVPFRLKWKATTKLYASFFIALDRVGFLYLYYWNGLNIVRHSKNLLMRISSVDPSLPYYQESQMNFTGFINSQNQLDTGLKLDEGWNIDSATAKQNTKHIAMEFFADRIITKDSKEYLMIPEFYSYINTNMDISKKATEVIHVGCQLNAITDSSHYYNSSGLAYTMPTIKLNAVTSSLFDSISLLSEIAFMEFGIGTKTNLPTSSGGVMPTALTEKLAKLRIIDDEKYSMLNWMGVTCSYPGNLINDISIGTGDGVTTTFSDTLPYVPVKPVNVKVSFISDLLTYTLEDDGYGIMKGTNAFGTIDYATGDITINTDIYYDYSVVAAVGDGIETSFDYTPDVEFTPLKPGSVKIKYIIGGSLFVATDTDLGSGTGSISGINCTGTVYYITGQILLTFSVPPVLNTDIVYEYKFQKITIVDAGTNVMIEYYFTTESIEITESSITDANGNLLAYSTFPPIKFKDYKNHLTMGFLLNKETF